MQYSLNIKSSIIAVKDGNRAKQPKRVSDQISIAIMALSPVTATETCNMME